MPRRLLRPDGSWKVGPFCPKCESERIEELTKGANAPVYYRCEHCGYSKPKEGNDWYRDVPDEGGEG